MGGALAGSLHKLSSFGGRFLRLTTPEVGGEVSTVLDTESDPEPNPEDINGLIQKSSMGRIQKSEKTLVQR